MNSSYEVYCTVLDQPLLLIPVEDARQYSTKPLKWLRYATAAVLGSKGYLLKYTGDEHDVYIALDMEDECPSARKLIFKPISQIQFVDKNMCYTSPSDITQNTDSQESFRNKLAGRDKFTVSEGLPLSVGCACHIIPYSKGSDYIRAVCKWRNDTEDPGIEDIDDIRNGLYLGHGTHVWLGRGLLGVLHTPNFALSTNEVLPPTTEPPENEFRFTPHYFYEGELSEKSQKFINASLQDFIYPTVTDGWPKDWPPAFLFDFNYGVAIARRYGNLNAMNILSNQLKSHYPSDCIKTRDRAQSEIESRETEMLEGDADCREAQKTPDAMDGVLSLSTLFSSHCIGTMEDESRKRQDQVAEKVDAWRTDVEPKRHSESECGFVNL